MDRRQTIRNLTLIALGSALKGRARIAAAQEPRAVVPSYNHVSDDEEIELGRKFAAQLEKEMEIVQNPQVDRYLSGIVQRLAFSSQRPNLPYTIHLVNSHDVNASSLAGGFIYLHRGLVEQLATEDELVATIAHELGHVVARHSINAVIRSFAARRLLNTVLANLFQRNGVVERIIAQLGGSAAILTLLHFSREDEREADMLGFYEMLRAGWNPQGFERLFHLLLSLEQKTAARRSQYLSSHPPTADRLQAIQQELRTASIPQQNRSDSASFHQFQRLVAGLHPPVKITRTAPSAQ